MSSSETPKGGADVSEPAAPLSCSVCYHEIPVSAAVWREGSDYAAYFCGLECYDAWRNQQVPLTPTAFS